MSLGLLLVPLLARAQGPMVFLPYWESDPLRSVGLEPNIGLTPWWSMLFDCVSLLGTAGLLALAPPARKRWVLWVLMGLAGLGTFGVLHHGWMVGAWTFKTRLIGMAWVSALIGAVAAREACRDARVKAVTFAVLTGFVLMLACKGVMQYFWEHPQTLAAFRANRQQIFADNGWTVDSSMARSYERRVSQAEASGWFGFSNVFATFAAAGLAGFVGLIQAAWRGRKDAAGVKHPGTQMALMIGAAALCGTAVALAGSKGGTAAAGLGVGLAVAGVTAVRMGMEPRRGAWIAPGLVGLSLLAVVMRGMLGERLHELSLLFRWFYMQGAGHIFRRHPWFGVGPDGFQEAYALAKNPLSPEDVSSPHSILLDWASCLGVFGIAWAVLFIVLLALAGRALLSPTQSPVTHTRWLIRAACLIAAVSMAVAIPCQIAAILPEEALGVRLLGLGLWCLGSGVAVVIAARSDLWRVGLFAAAAVVAVHCQIELTGVLPQSVGLAMVLIGAASACHGPGLGQVREGDAEARTSQSRGPWHVRWCTLVPVGLAVFFVLRGALLACAWEGKLAKAYRVLEEAAPLREKSRAASQNGRPEATRLQGKLLALETRLIPLALPLLPVDEWSVKRAASELAVEYAQRLLQGNRNGDAINALRGAYLYVVDPKNAEDMIRTGGRGDRPPRGGTFVGPEPLPSIPSGLTISQHGWLATLALELAKAEPAAPWLQRAAEHLEAVEALDPYTPQHPARLMEVYEQLGRRESAWHAAKRALAANDFQRLDKEARGLEDRVRVKAERLAK